MEKQGLNACVVHPSGILGPEDFAVGETTKTVIQIINGEMPAGIDGSFNLCDVRDLAHGTILAADKGRKGSCYILGNEEVTFKDFARILSEESGCKKMKLFLPCSAANFMAGLLEKKAKRSGKRPLMTTFSVYNSTAHGHSRSLAIRRVPIRKPSTMRWSGCVRAGKSHRNFAIYFSAILQ